MALPDHWLDDVFETPDGSQERLVKHRKFVAAVAAAKSAYLDAVNTQKDAEERGEFITGGTPSQCARMAFIESMELQIRTEE